MARLRNGEEPIMALSDDLEALSLVAGVYEGLIEEDVFVVAGDFIPDEIDKSRGLASKIEHRLGGLANSEATVIALIEADAGERKILKYGRRLLADSRL